MDKNKDKSKSPSVWERLWQRPTGPTQAQAKDNRPSIAERINFGGRFPDKQEKPKSKDKTY